MLHKRAARKPPLCMRQCHASSAQLEARSLRRAHAAEGLFPWRNSSLPHFCEAAFPFLLGYRGRSGCCYEIDPGDPQSRSQSGLSSEVLHDGPKSKELVLLQDGMAAVEIASCKQTRKVLGTCAALYKHRSTLGLLASGLHTLPFMGCGCLVHTHLVN